MKRKLLLGLGLLLSIGVKGQFSPFNYVVNVDLDTTATFSHNGTGTVSVLRNSPSTTQFFPHPAGAYTARALFTNTANSDLSLASNKLTLKNPATSLVKASIYDIQNASAIAKFAFDLDLTNYTGLATFAISFGNDGGSGARLISGSTSYAAATGDIFGALRIANGGSAGRTQYRNAAGNGDVLLTTGESLIEPGVSQRVEIFVNSTGSTISYTHVSSPTAISLAANTYHIYVGNIKYDVDFPKSGTAYAQSALDGLTFEFNNNATQETISISNLSITYQANTLPVSLTSFTGNLNNNAVDLKWTTASEQNNSHFNILRSADSKNFTVLDRVEGSVTTAESKEYRFTDRSPLTGTNYYQLKQYDLDGKENVIDRIVAVKTTLGTSDFTVFVNQENQLTASIFSYNKSIAKIGLFDIAGNELLNEDVDLEKGNNLFTRHMPFLKKGVYILRLSSEGDTKSVKFIK